MRHALFGVLALLVVGAVACDQGTPGPPEALPTPSPSEEGTAAAPPGEAAPSGETPANAVANEPAVEAPPQVPDFQLATRINVRMLADEVTRGEATTIRVRVREGAVWLEGSAETALASLRAQAIAEGTYGVASVHNAIEAPTATDADREAAAQVPEAVMATEPQFGDGAHNYATGEMVDPLEVVRRPPGASTATPPSSAPPAEETAAEPEAEAEEAPEIEERTAPVTSGRTVTVQDGDSLWTIANEHLGSGARWQELFEVNRELLNNDPDEVRPGMVLTLPQ